MTYELAKQLKDAGFEQGYVSEGGKYICPHGGHSVSTRVCEEDVYVPPLSELIEACGKDFGSLMQFEDWHTISFHNLQNKIDLGFSGKTPEEAVAKLWLALNKK